LRILAGPWAIPERFGAGTVVSKDPSDQRDGGEMRFDNRQNRPILL